MPALKERLDATYREQTALLQQVRRGVADLATSRKRVELQRASLQQQIDALGRQAADAVAHGSDDDARAILTRKIGLEKVAAELAERHAGLVADEAKLQDAAQQVQLKVDEFRLRKDTLAARHSAATARAEINSATTGISSSMGSVGQAMAEAERHTRELEATADAVDELVAEGVIEGPGSPRVSDSDLWQRHFDAPSTAGEVDRQLTELGRPEGERRGPDQIQG